MRLMCPLCGESDHLDTWPFIDDDGAARLRLTCTSDSHDAPVVVAHDDPDAPPTRRALADEGTLAGELDLYPKPEGVVRDLPGFAEHGIVEHLFAFAHPDDYRRLWREFGHIATHGVK